MQRLLRITPKTYHAMFGESFSTVAPLAAVVGVATTIIVAHTGHTLLAHPDVHLNQRKRGLIIHDNDGSYRSHWVKDVSAKNAGTDMTEYTTNVFGLVNSSMLGGARPRLDMDKVEKL